MLIILNHLLHKAIGAEDCLDTIKEYLIGMVESWNNDRINLHTGISSVVTSFDSKKDYKYLSLRCPSNLDSGVGTCPSTSSLPRRSRPSRESPLTGPPSIPPRPKESLSENSQELSQSVEIHRNTVASVVPVGGVQNPSATFPRTSCVELPSRQRRINHPMIPHSRRSYIFRDTIQRRTSAPWQLVSGLGARPNPMDRQADHRKLCSHQPSTPLNLPQRSHSSVQTPGYPPPLPQRRHSDSVSSHINAPSRFSPTLDGCIEDDEEEDYEDAYYSTIGALEYIAPKQLKLEGRPNIGKLQKKLWKRNSTLKKGRRPSVHKRSLTHSSDASSDDSDAPKSKPKPQRRVSSYHPPHRHSVTRLTRRKTAGSIPNLDSLVEDGIPKTPDVDHDQSSTLDIVNAHIAAAIEGDNEASEHHSGKSSGVRHMHLEYNGTMYSNPYSINHQLRLCR